MSTIAKVDSSSDNNDHSKPNNSTSKHDKHSSTMCNIDFNDDYSCGLCSFKPKYLQPCANEKAFLAVFCLTSVLQGMFYTYFVSVLTTIEKLYQIQSKTTGLIMSATEMGQISGVLFLTYYGGQGNRPKWIACGMIVFALAALLSASPHYFFDTQARERFSPRSDFSKSSTSSSLPSLTSSSSFSTSSSSPSPLISNNFNSSDKRYIGLARMKGQLCLPSNLQINFDPSNRSSNLISSSASESRCGSEESNNNANRLTNSVLAIFFISLLFIGIGSTTTNTLGIPYIDDNVAPKESPLYFGITIGVKIFGPVIGFLLGSICTNIHVDFPFGESTINNPSDPQWIGAWWLGMIVVFLSLLIASIFMMSFPKQLPKPGASSFSHFQQQQKYTAIQANLIKDEETSRQLNVTFTNHQHEEPSVIVNDPLTSESLDISEKKNAQEDEEKDFPKAASATSHRPNLKDFPSTIRRLVKNDILLLRIASSVLHILPIAGIYNFLPKYLESQFQLTASQASAVAGIAGILVMGVGIFSSSFFMRKFKTTPKFLALWIAIAALIYSIGMVILMGVGCQTSQLVDHHLNGSDGSNNCLGDCSCSGHFAPICTSQKTTYLSPCIAGCTKVALNASTYVYSDCTCLDFNVTATNGYCPLECSNLTWYIVIFATIVLVHSTCEVGSMLLTLRCVEPKDKAMALGLVSFSIGLFGNVPCPILYGFVVDSACLFWEKNCGKLGACRVYDSFRFRTAFHGLTAFIMFIAFLVDIFVWFRASSIKFTDEGELEGDANKPNKQSQSLSTVKSKTMNACDDAKDQEVEEEEDEDNVYAKDVTNSNGVRSSELEPLKTSKSNENTNDMV